MRNQEFFDANFPPLYYGDLFPVAFLSRRLKWVDTEIRNLEGSMPFNGTVQEMDNWALDLQDVHYIREVIMQDLTPFLN